MRRIACLPHFVFFCAFRERLMLARPPVLHAGVFACTRELPGKRGKIRSSAKQIEAHWIWWLVAVVIAEISNGAFYLIAIAFVLAVANVVAYMGMTWSGQAAVAAVLRSAMVSTTMQLVKKS